VTVTITYRHRPLSSSVSLVDFTFYFAEELLRVGTDKEKRAIRRRIGGSLISNNSIDLKEVVLWKRRQLKEKNRTSSAVFCHLSSFLVSSLRFRFRFGFSLFSSTCRGFSSVLSLLCYCHRRPRLVSSRLLILHLVRACASGV